MHIINQDKKPYLIITKDELLFRENPSDKDMQRHQYTSIEKINLVQENNDDNEMTTWLEVNMKGIKAPLLVQISALDDSLEEILSLLKSSLEKKVQLSFLEKTPLEKRAGKPMGKKLVPLVLIFAIAGLPIFHILFPPTLEDLRSNYLKALYEADDSFCSARSKAAYPGTHNDLISIVRYCGVLGIWKEESIKSISKKHLETEFSQLRYSDYISEAKRQITDASYNNAIESLDKAIYLDPNNEQAYLMLSQAYNLDDNKALALKNYQKVLSLNPNSFEAHNAMGDIYAEEENYKKAQEHYAKSVQIKATAKGYISLAQVELTLGNTDQAIENFEHSLLKDANNTLVLSRLGLLYWEKQAYKKAAEVFEKAYNISPKDSSHFLNYYEISLIEPTPLSKQDKEDFIQTFSQDKAALMVYKVLEIIELSIKEKDILPALKQWDERYSGQKLNWSFTQILSWLDTSTLSEEDKHRIKRTIGFFIAYQQIYNLEHQKALTGEQL